MFHKFFLVLVCALPLVMASGCTDSEQTAAVQGVENFPTYPNAVKSEAMSQSAVGGMVSVGLEQYTTEDSYEEVLGFYQEALAPYETKIATFEIDQGRQTAIEVVLESSNATLAIQEFSDEGKVAITLMWGKAG